MKEAESLMQTVAESLRKLARKNAVVAKPISVGSRHVLPLVELSAGWGGGAGRGEGDEDGKGTGKGFGGGVGGAAKASPVAVIVVDGDEVTIEGVGA